MRRRVQWIAGVLGFVLLALSSAAQALMPIVPEQLLCSGAYVFVGRVLSVANRDCRLTKPASQCSTSNRNDVELDVVITRILGVRPEMLTAPAIGLRVGQTIRPMAAALAAPYQIGKYDGEGRLAFVAPYDAILPDERLKEAYLDQEFVFSGEAKFVHIWPLDKMPWAQETMTQAGRPSDGRRCPTPL